MSDPSSPSPRAAHGRFAPGNPGGPGRPRGAVSAAAAALDRIAIEAQEELVNVVLDKARAGDLKAIEMLWSRVWPLRRGRPLAFGAPPIVEAADVAPAQASVTEAVLSGEITAAEAAPVLDVIKSQKEAIGSEAFRREWQEIERRLAAARAGEPK